MPGAVAVGHAMPLLQQENESMLTLYVAGMKADKYVCNLFTTIVETAVLASNGIQYARGAAT